MDGDTTERLSQESQCPKDGFNGLLARASAFAGGVLSAIQALAGTTACKGVQIARLRDWAKENKKIRPQRRISLRPYLLAFVNYLIFYYFSLDVLLVDFPFL